MKNKSTVFDVAIDHSKTATFDQKIAVVPSVSECKIIF